MIVFTEFKEIATERLATCQGSQFISDGARFGLKWSGCEGSGQSVVEWLKGGLRGSHWEAVEASEHGRNMTGFINSRKIFWRHCGSLRCHSSACFLSGDALSSSIPFLTPSYCSLTVLWEICLSVCLWPDCELQGGMDLFTHLGIFQARHRA